MYKIRNAGIKFYCKARVLGKAVREKLSNTDGSFIEEGGKMLIAVVLCMAILVFAYLLLKNTIFPNVTTKSNDMFNYAG